ncbi:IS630 family transposase [Vibrio parahaemolyticus]|nr:IS630 family transposase [Vibrio parahaemolyticus]MDF4467066.1 IS630 family transposase [Vibrio parahaemolyticus]MDF4471804.1 IS630 family transposase [Vibrio parahaemolyticus]MDF4495068.1 IS630 family transposase [Vibrio parahaemolyticus]MDG2571177.1 IS630 family transposase [Vibrio parahaemolyticus]
MDINFSELIHSTSNARLRIRYLAIAHFEEGMSRTDIAKILKVSRTSVNAWVASYKQFGLDGLTGKSHPGRPCNLSQKQLEQFKQYVTESAIKPDGGRLQGEDFVAYIEEQFNVKYGVHNVYRLLHKLGLNWITTRSKHPEQSEEAQEAFKKIFLIETITKIPGHMALNRVHVWFQDEARFGQRNTTTRIWALKGTRPRAIQQQQFEYAYLFGAVCINTGNTEAIVAPVSNMEVMQEQLRLISEATPAGYHSVVIMDRASWHQSYLADEFSNITIIHLPPYSPELNPVEQVWAWLRNNELANRCFNGYEDIKNELCEAWSRFSQSTERVISMCYRSWTELAS